jgi:hypothetical protein
VSRARPPVRRRGKPGRFLINTELDSATAPITLLQNWHLEATK